LLANGGKDKITEKAREIVTDHSGNNSINMGPNIRPDGGARLRREGLKPLGNRNIAGAAEVTLTSSRIGRTAQESGSLAVRKCSGAADPKKPF